MKNRSLKFCLVSLIAVAQPFSLSVFGQEKQRVELVVRTGHPEAVTSVAFSPSGDTLISGSNDNTIKLWNISTGIELKTFSGHSDSVNQVAFNPDGKTLVSGSSDGNIKLWDVATGKELRSFHRANYTFSLRETPVRYVAFSPDGKTLVGESYNDTITLWDVETGRVLRNISGPSDSIRSVAFSPDGQTLVGVISLKNTVKFWDVKSGKEQQTPLNQAPLVSPVTFSPDGKTLASGSPDRTLKLWDVASGKELRTFPVTSVDPIAFSPDGKILLSGNRDNTIGLWDVASGRELKTLSGHSSGILAVTFSPDGKTLASGSYDNSIKLWDVASGKALKTFSGRSTQVTSVSFSPDGKTLATIGYLDKRIKLWDIISGIELRTLSGHSDSVDVVAFSPDGKILASGGEDKTVKLWDTRTGKELRTLSGHADRITAFEFSSDGKTLGSGSWDNVFKLWDVETGKDLKTVKKIDMDALLEMVRAFPKLVGNHFTSVVTQSKTEANSDSLIAQITDNTKIKLSDKRTNRELATLIAIDENDWVVTTPEGRFDTSKSLDRIEGLHWIVNDEISKPLPLDIFMRQYYEPQLLRRILAGENFKPLPSIADINRVQPKVEIIGSPKPLANEPDVVEVTVAVENAKGMQNRNGRLVGLESGVYDLRVFRNGQLVGYDPPRTGATIPQVVNTNKMFSDAEQDAQWRRATEVKLDKGGRATRTFKVRLPRGTGARQVELAAYAFNADGVRSEMPSKLVENPVALATIKPRAYVITVGVNANENEAWDLSFAANDARRIERNMREHLLRTGQYALEDIVTVSLIADYAKGADGTKALPRRITENYATKRNFRTVLELLAGKAVDPALVRQLPDDQRLQAALHRANPEDLVLISFSSHGYADARGNFYLVPYDMSVGAGMNLASGDVLRRSISSEELSYWLRDVDAGEMTMIIDACHAAASVQTAGFKPGPMASRGLGQLAYNKGMRILTSTQAGDKAWEADALSATSNAGGADDTGNRMGVGAGNGLLTYVLTRDGLETFKADANGDRSITLSEWLIYGVRGVPELAQALQQHIDQLQIAQLKSIRLGGGRAARVIVLNRENNKGPANLELQQQPSLFDFARRRRDPIIAVRN